MKAGKLYASPNAHDRHYQKLVPKTSNRIRVPWTGTSFWHCFLLHVSCA